MQWLERLLGPSEYRRYGDNEYYEYPRPGAACREFTGGFEFDRESERAAISWSWRGPSIFEDPNAGHTYEDTYSSNHRTSYNNRNNLGGLSERSNGDEDRSSRSSSRDTSKYVSQYGGTTEIYHPASGKFGDSGDGRTVTGRQKIEDYGTRGEGLARALQNSLSLSDQSRGSYGTTRKSVGMSTCAGCHGSIGFRRFLTCLNQNWHPSCFCCKACHEAILDKEFSVHGSDPYHRHCYRKLFHPKCEICYHHIPVNAQGQIEYRSHPFWNQRYCPSHERDGSTCCCSCDRIEAVDQRYETLGDGRKVCSECHDSAVTTTKNCQPLFRDVLTFFSASLGMPIEQQVPMLLVEREALNNAREVESDSHTHAPETRGLCLSEEHILPVSEHDASECDTETRKQTRRCEVTAILVLYGLPRLLTGSILAHELMHAWIRLDGRFPSLENDIEEGICQVIAHMWLKSELESLMRRGYNGGSSINKRLGEFFIHQIETDSSPVYGDGFRAAWASVAKYGLPQTLHHLRQTGEILQ